MAKTWTLEIVQERGGWRRRCIAPDLTVYFEAWGRTPLDFPPSAEAELVTHQVQSGALALLDSIARSSSIDLDRCEFCRLPSGWGDHQH